MFLPRAAHVWQDSDTSCDHTMLSVANLDIHNHWFKGNHRNSRQEMYEYRNIDALSRNHCCCGKAIIIKYSECGSVVLANQYAKRMRRIVTCGLSGSNLFFNIIS